jgi:DNA repair photolyase
VTKLKAKSPSRGALANPPTRFQKLHLEMDADYDPANDPSPRTRFYQDHTTSVLNRNESPDLGFDYTLNPYRGCEHGCIYCYARPTHEYLGFSAGLDFESRIMVKEDAPRLLREQLSSPHWQPQVIALSGVTDCYQPIERRLKLTRRCLEVLAEFRNPVGIVTKNNLVIRDIDLLAELAGVGAASVHLSVTTLDTDLRGILEPRTSPPQARLHAIRDLAQAGIPVGVLVAPIIPGLTDHELPRILEAAAEAGARFADYTVLRLPLAVGGLFEEWLEQHLPGQKEKVLGRLRSLHDGRLSDSTFGRRFAGSGHLAEQIHQLFEVSSRRVGLAHGGPDLSTTAFRRHTSQQLTFFA